MRGGLGEPVARTGEADRLHRVVQRAQRLPIGWCGAVTLCGAQSSRIAPEFRHPSLCPPAPWLGLLVAYRRRRSWVDNLGTQCHAARYGGLTTEAVGCGGGPLAEVGNGGAEHHPSEARVP